MRSLITRLALAACLGVAGCLSNLQKEVRKSGFIPLENLDLVQIVPPEGGKVYSDQVVIGSIYAWPGDREGRLKHPLRPSPNPARPTYAFDIALAKGPDEVLKTANADAKLTVDKIDIGSWAKANFEASASANSQVKLNKLWQGSLKIEPDNLVALFVAADPPRDIAAPRDYLWVTGFLAGDVDDFSNAGIRLRADAELAIPGSTTTKPTTYPVSVNVGADGKDTLKGPGLLVGLKGQVITTSVLGVLPEISLPTLEQQQVVFPLKLADGTTAEFLILRRQPHDIRLDIRNATNTTVYVKDINDTWTKDVPSKAEPAKLPVPEMVPFAIFGDNLTRAVVLERRGFGDETTVYSVVVSPKGNGKTFVLSGAVYRVVLREAKMDE